MSNSWETADGSYEPTVRGTMTEADLRRVLRHVLTVKEPDYTNGDLCPPNIQVEAPIGNFSFSLNNGSYYNPELDAYDISPEAALDVATGRTPVTPPKLTETNTVPSSGSGKAAVTAPPPKTGKVRKAIAFIIAGTAVVFGLVVALGLVGEKMYGSAAIVALVFLVFGPLCYYGLSPKKGAGGDAAGASAMAMGYHAHWMESSTDSDYGGDSGGDTGGDFGGGE